MIRSGEQFMRNAVKRRVFLHTSITAGSGHTRRSLRRQDLPLFLDADLIRVSLRRTAPMQRSTNLIPSIP